jgi:hypothetical protein
MYYKKHIFAIKKTFILITLLTSILLSANASEIKGIIITKKDTLHVSFLIPFTGINRTTLQSGVKYIDSLGIKCKLRPEDAKEFQFEYNGEKIRMLSRFDNLSYNSDGSSKIFLQVVIDGPIKLFNYYMKNSYMSSPGGPGSTTMMTSNTYSKYVLQKGVGDLVLYSQMNFKNEMPIFVKKCPDLVRLIQDKVYGRGDIERIVNFYNTNCGSN